MTDHEAELATLHQEATQQRARIKRLEAALAWYRDQNLIAQKPTIDAQWAQQRLKDDAGRVAREALQEAGQ